jgi:hypothetical protein
MGRVTVMIHHEGTKATKDTKGAWEVEGFGTRSHHQVVGVIRVRGALLDWDPFVSLVPFVPSW